MPHPLQHLVLARLVAKREGGLQLERGHLLREPHPPPKARQDLAVKLLDRLTQRKEVARLRHGRRSLA